MRHIIDTATLSHISGHHSDDAKELKLIHRTGNVMSLTEAQRQAAGDVPEIMTKTDEQEYTGAFVVTADAVTYEVRDKTVEELAAEAKAGQGFQLDHLLEVNRAMMRLLITLINHLLATDTISAGDFSTEEQSLYQAIKTHKASLYP